MIVYIKQGNYPNKIFRTIKIREQENKCIIDIPICKKTKLKKQEKIAQKLCKYMYKNVIKNVVLDKELMKNDIFKNILYSNNINILDGKKLSNFLVYSIIEKIYKYKNKNIQSGEITLLVNEQNGINTQNIFNIAKNIKRLNIITSNTKKFKKIVEYLYNELGIIIKLTNNTKFNLNTSDIIVNVDYTEDMLNRLNIPANSIIVNIPKNIKINSKKFAGINIRDFEIEIPEKYIIENFEKNCLYEASILNKPEKQVFEQIETDNIDIINLIGINGIINKKEFA